MKRTLVFLIALALLAAPLTALQQDVNISDDPLLAQWLQLGRQLRENGTYPYVELRREDRGYEVIALQTRLFQLNYYDKDIVPVFGAGTEAAMRRFEKANALRVNGWASVEDQRLLFQSAALAAPGTTPKPQTEGAGTAPPPALPTDAPQTPSVASPTAKPLSTLPPGPLQTVPPDATATATPAPTVKIQVTFKPPKLITLAPTAAPTQFPPELSTLAPKWTAPPLTTLKPELVKPGIPGLP